MSDVSKENQIPVTQIEVTPQAPSVWSTLFGMVFGKIIVH